MEAGPLWSLVRTRNVVTDGGGRRACTEADKDKFEVAFQKLLWTPIFWLLCHAEGVGGSTVGEIIEDPTGLELVRGGE